MKVEVAVLGSPSLTVRTVSVDVKATLSYNLSKHGAERPQKPQGLLGTGERRETVVPIATLSSSE